MPIRLSLLAVLVCTAAAAQAPPFIPAPIDPVAVGGFRPVSVEVQVWKDAAWVPDGRTLNTYDEAGRLTEVVDQERDGDGWADVRRVASAYDDRDSLVQTVREVWEGEAWLPVERKSYGYDVEGRRRQLVAQAWREGAWADSARVSYGYDAAGNRTGATWEWWEGEEVSTYRSVSTYNASGRETERRFQESTASGWADQSRTVWSYNEEGLLAEERLEGWNGAEWSAGLRTRYAYDREGRLVEEVGQGRDLETGEWSGGSRRTRSYDEAARLAEFVFAVWTEGAWFNWLGWTYEYDEDGNLSEVVFERQDYNDRVWAPSTLFVFAYERATDTEAVARSSELALVVAPNPSTGAAAISFEVATPQPVRVAVYDALGREVAVLADGPRAAGPHRLSLGRAVPPGVYVVRVMGETVSGARTLTVVR